MVEEADAADGEMVEDVDVKDVEILVETADVEKVELVL